MILLSRSSCSQNGGAPLKHFASPVFVRGLTPSPPQFKRFYPLLFAHSVNARRYSVPSHQRHRRAFPNLAKRKGAPGSITAPKVRWMIGL
jgi:hypothetical protein